MGEAACDESEVTFARPEVSTRTNTQYVPKWMKPRFGASFGFGGKVVTFQGKCLKVVTQLQHHREKELSREIKDFDQEVT